MLFNISIPLSLRISIIGAGATTRLFILDCDKTLWDGISSHLIGALKRSGEDSIVDPLGRRIRLYPTVRETLKSLSDQGDLLAFVSWNARSSHLLLVLKLFGLLPLFRYGSVSLRHNKVRMVSQILQKTRDDGIDQELLRVYFIDDVRRALRQVSTHYPWITVIQAKGLKTFELLTSVT
jgi:magnesium-dependent phosphatase-1